MSEYLPLCALSVGQSAHVTALETAPDMRRRLLHLGLIPGTKVQCVAKSPAGDPAAYLVRGAVFALRRSDAGGIRVERLESPARVGHPALA